MSTVVKETALADVQGYSDHRHIAIDRVGVTKVRYPIRVITRDGETQPTIGTFDMFVWLPHDRKGTHMSRFMTMIETFRLQPLTSETLREFGGEMCRFLDTERSQIDASFPLFLTRAAPVTGVTGMMEYRCGYTVVQGSATDIVLRVELEIGTLCPCSKEISDRGAHNQRGLVKLRVRTSGDVPFEDLIDIVERNASCPLYPVLKRPDERYVTEKAYDNPRFVEDVVRDIVGTLEEDGRFDWASVEIENLESIHQHNAYASIEYRR